MEQFVLEMSPGNKPTSPALTLLRVRYTETQKHTYKTGYGNDLTFAYGL